MTHPAVKATLDRPGGPHTCYGDDKTPNNHECDCRIGGHHTAAQHRTDMRLRAADEAAARAYARGETDVPPLRSPGPDTTPTADLERTLR